MCIAFLSLEITTKSTTQNCILKESYMRSSTCLCGTYEAIASSELALLSMKTGNSVELASLVPSKVKTNNL